MISLAPLAEAGDLKMMLLRCKAMLLADCGYKSFKLLGVNFGMTLAGYTVEVMVMWLEGSCEFIMLFPSVIDDSGDT